MDYLKQDVKKKYVALTELSNINSSDTFPVLVQFDCSFLISFHYNSSSELCKLIKFWVIVDYLYTVMYGSVSAILF